MQAFLSERVLVLFGLLICAIALMATTFGPDYTDVGSAHSPVFFPRIILTLWIGLATLAVAQALRDKGQTSSVYGWIGLVVLVLAALVYTNLMASYGFFLTSLAFSVVALVIFRVRNPLVVGAYSVLVPGALVLLFNHLLGMPLPTSPFTYLF